MMSDIDVDKTIETLCTGEYVIDIMRTIDLPPKMRKPWREMLRIVAEDDADACDLLAHFEIYMRGVEFNAQDGTIIDDAGNVWALDGVIPYCIHR